MHVDALEVNMNIIGSPLYYLVILAMAVSVMSLTVTKTKVFKFLRDWIKSKNKFIGELFSCPYCFSFYPSAVLVVLYGSKIRLLTDGIVSIDYVISYFCLVCLASFFTGFIYKSISQIE